MKSSFSDQTNVSIYNSKTMTKARSSVCYVGHVAFELVFII